MKKIILLLAVVGITVFTSCTGPEGIPGQNGKDGLPGYINEVFEVNADFSTSNQFSNTYTLNPVIFKDDSLLVYELINTNGGIDTWALLPQVYYFSLGTAQYNYNFSFDQFTVLIDSNFDKTLLPSNFRLGKTFRVVIIPGDSGTTNKKVVDVKDYHAVIKAYNIDDSNVKILK